MPSILPVPSLKLIKVSGLPFLSLICLTLFIKHTSAALFVSFESSLIFFDLILKRLLMSINKTKRDFGRLDVEWGQIQRLVRGKVNISLSGGPDILRAIYTVDEGKYKKAIAGDCYFQIVEWSPNGQVSSKSIHQYGSSTLDENSPHYSDQAHLFAKNEMKPIWINLKDIKLNLWKSYSPNGQVVTKE